MASMKYELSLKDGAIKAVQFISHEDPTGDAGPEGPALTAITNVSNEEV